MLQSFTVWSGALPGGHEGCAPSPMKHPLPFVAAFLLAATAALPATDAPPAKPNIVFLFSDDQTARAVGCYGNKEVLTPHLDRLAQDGVRFTNHYNTTAICMASRCSVLTGLYEYRHGCNFSHGGDINGRWFARPRLRLYARAMAMRLWPMGGRATVDSRKWTMGKMARS